jgi:hypothetical protein
MYPSTPRTSRDLIITTRWPALAREALVFIAEGSDYALLTASIAAEIGAVSDNELRFYHMSVDGWANEIRSGYVISMS